MGVYTKLMQVQSELKAPKGQYNSFGKYKYRSCEDILEALKPVLARAKAVVNISDELVLIGERYYVKATATFIDVETGESVSNTAYAREEESKKGMDGSQITGTASSYARKYLLNGLFLIDDTKDADTDEYQQQGAAKAQQSNKPAANAQQKPQDKITMHGQYVRYINDTECQLLAKDGNWYPVDKLQSAQLEKLLTEPSFAAAYGAINAVLMARGA